MKRYIIILSILTVILAGCNKNESNYNNGCFNEPYLIFDKNEKYEKVKEAIINFEKREILESSTPNQLVFKGENNKIKKVIYTLFDLNGNHDYQHVTIEFYESLITMDELTGLFDSPWYEKIETTENNNIYYKDLLRNLIIELEYIYDYDSLTDITFKIKLTYSPIIEQPKTSVIFLNNKPHDLPGSMIIYGKYVTHSSSVQIMKFAEIEYLDDIPQGAISKEIFIDDEILNEAEGIFFGYELYALNSTNWFLDEYLTIKKNTRNVFILDRYSYFIYMYLEGLE